MENVITRNTEELERLEGIIQKNVGSYLEIGNALRKIKDDELYSKVRGIATFETYCKERWDFGRQIAYQYIGAAKATENVSHGLQNVALPTNERQTRPLTKIKDPDQQCIAWQKAIDITPEGKTTTAAIVAKVVKEMTGADTPTAEKDAESDSLFHLKRWWNKATIKDKKIFQLWINEAEK